MENEIEQIKKKKLSHDEIREILRGMRVDLKKILPLRYFTLLVKNPDYDPDNFSQEIEDSEVEIDVFSEVKKEAKKEGVSWLLNWNRLLKKINNNSQKWKDNHTKSKYITILPCEFLAACVEHTITIDDGKNVVTTSIRDFDTDKVMEEIKKIENKYGEIYGVF